MCGSECQETENRLLNTTVFVNSCSVLIFFIYLFIDSFVCFEMSCLSFRPTNVHVIDFSLDLPNYKHL